MCGERIVHNSGDAGKHYGPCLWGRLPLGFETVYAAVSVCVGVSSILFWQAASSRGHVVPQSGPVTMEVTMPVPVHISLRIPGTAPIQEIASLVRGVEAAGFAGAGILDSQLLCRDTYVTLALAATQRCAAPRSTVS